MIEHELIEIEAGSCEPFVKMINKQISKSSSPTIRSKQGGSITETLDRYNLSEREWNIILSGAEEVVYIDKEILIKQGEPFKYFFKIKTGNVSIQKMTSRDSMNTVAELHSGDFFGEMSLLGRKTMAYCVASGVKKKKLSTN